MAKTIAQKSVELAELNAKLTGDLAGAQAMLGEATAKIEALTAQAADLKAKLDLSVAAVAEQSARADAAEENVQTVTAERDAHAARVKELSATLALHPEVKQPDGQAPVPGADSPAGSEQPATWADAVKACGGDYVAARRKFPKIHEEYLAAATPKK